MDIFFCIIYKFLQKIILGVHLDFQTKTRYDESFHQDIHMIQNHQILNLKYSISFQTQLW